MSACSFKFLPVPSTSLTCLANTWLWTCHQAPLTRNRHTAVITLRSPACPDRATNRAVSVPSPCPDRASLLATLAYRLLLRYFARFYVRRAAHHAAGAPQQSWPSCRDDDRCMKAVRQSQRRAMPNACVSRAPIRSDLVDSRSSGFPDVALLRLARSHYAGPQLPPQPTNVRPISNPGISESSLMLSVRRVDR